MKKGWMEEGGMEDQQKGQMRKADEEWDEG